MNWFDAILVMYLFWTLCDGSVETYRKLRGWDQIVKRNQGRK